MIKKSLFLLLIFINSLFAKSNIIVYSAYGNAHHIIIQGRMEKEKKFKSVSVDDNWFKNIYRRFREVTSDEIKNNIIIATINQENFLTKGDSEGYFEFDIKTKKAIKSGYQNIKLQIQNNPSIKSILATIIGSKPLIGIISDFDDTLIISNVTNKLKLGINTIFKNYKQRKIVPGMVERFNKILAQNPKESPSTLFILSGSPQQLFKPINSFLNYHHFPRRILILKKAYGDRKDPLTDQFAYKTQKIEQLIKLYPNIKWVMFGDSGEKDLQVYQFFKSKYPNKIKEYYIRDIKSGKIYKSYKKKNI